MKAQARAVANMATTMLKKTLILKEDQLFFFKVKEPPQTLNFDENSLEDVVHIIISQGRDCNLDLKDHTNND